MDLTSLIVIQVLSLGLTAGVLGGMLGVGGSVLMIPGLTLIFGYNQHLYQAAAMIANVAVAVPAARKHYQAGAVTPTALPWMIVAAMLCVSAGVWLSNRPVFSGIQGGLWLGRLLGAFLVYVVIINIGRFVRASDLGQRQPSSTVTPVRAGVVGSIMGTIGGLLGIGGGTIAVPLQQMLLRLPLRSSIANSTVVICFSASLGAVYKNATLSQHGYDWHESVIYALLLAPSCLLGGHLGAALTHRLPVRQVRLAFICVMLIAAVKMLAIPWS